jgi:hypothetical protein
MLTTGARDDGLAGLWEIKRHGGKTNDIVGQSVVLQDNAKMRRGNPSQSAVASQETLVGSIKSK